MAADWMSVEDIAQELSLNPETVRGWIRTKQLPAFKFGHVYRVRRVDYEEFVKSRSTKEIEDHREKGRG